MSALSLDHVSLDLGGRRVLDDVSLTLVPGQAVGLIGPNGAGKTTLLRALTGLARPDRGEVRIDGRPLHGLSRAERARGIAYLPQGGAVHWALAARDVVALGRVPHGGGPGRMSALDHAAVRDAMVAADVLDLADRPVPKLSGGERSRVMLARALAQGARMLLADEPVAALDPHHQLRIMELLRAEARAGRACVAVLHDLTLAARHCDRLVLLHRGRVIADGAPEAVLTAERLAEVYEVEAVISRDAGGLSVLPVARRARAGVQASARIT